jgi:hypothetical protein
MKVTVRRFATETPEGDDYTAVNATLVLSTAEAADLMASYDPSSGTSPAAAVCRPVVRAILDAIRDHDSAAVVAP